MPSFTALHSFVASILFASTALAGDCPSGQVQDCADSDCIADFFIGDGFCDGTAQADGANLCCYENDGGDCLANGVECPIDGGGDGEGADCSNAISVSSGETFFDNSASALTVELIDICSGGGPNSDTYYKAMIFEWTCPQDGGYNASTCGAATFDTRMSIFEGNCEYQNVVACLDNTPGCAINTPTIEFPAAAGETYFICIGSIAPFISGTATLTIEPAERKLKAVINWTTDLGAPEDTQYELYEPPGATASWTTCLANAEENGDDLVSISSEAEDLAVRRTAGRLNSGVCAFGLYQETTANDYSEPAGGWRFTDGTSLVFTNWNTGEPNDVGGEDYGQIGTEGWNDNLNETDWRGYIVKRPGTPFRFTWEESDGGNGHEYEAFALPVDMTLEDAVTYAENRGGHLVTINSLPELQMIQAVMIPETYSPRGIAIGLVQNTSSPDYAEPAGGWEWVTGEPFDFNFWNSGEPNDSPSGENYAEMFSSGGWNDAAGETRAEAVIIEYEEGVKDCIEDLDGDGSVGGSDLTILLSSWNSSGSGDINQDGTTNGADLTLLLSKWGLCF
jgi:hypothetical protein